MADILLISGSPTASSRSGALLTYSQTWLLNKSSFETVLVSVRDFPADDLILAKYDSPAFDGLKQHVSNAVGIIVSTPIYKAAYTGSLKALLDILPQYAFRGKTVLPIASGGSPGHLLAIDYAIKPVLSTLGASDVLQGVYLVDQQFRVENGQPIIAEETQQRLDESLSQFLANLESRVTA
ncbi:MAG TPA: NADPH-dependent FMN reductase [Chthoniobacterales bacterium]|jgi:FMN reductase|nr:NADPH-dependent FMN reductase [Chthoniobacterales bacterium]